MNPKISEQQKSKPAYIYVRQSTLAQVRHHQESTERQYALQQKAMELGWSGTSTRILDRDLGISGAHTTGRTDFKTLVADVSMGQVGAVFALEASRLARSNADWHRLLELCALTRTLVIDEDGCYDPADFNDGLLLGLKGTMAQAELHFIRARLLGGKLNKAQKGELRFHSQWDSATTRMVISSLTPTRKCAARCPWCFACFAKQAVPSLWYRISSSGHCVFQNALTAGPGMASSCGDVLLILACYACSRTRLMPACMSLVATSIIKRSARRARFRKKCVRLPCPTGASN
jgi:DNA invertase Pin-like site-specific DNA recombinase